MNEIQKVCVCLTLYCDSVVVFDGVLAVSGSADVLSIIRLQHIGYLQPAVVVQFLGAVWRQSGVYPVPVHLWSRSESQKTSPFSMP